MKKDTIPVLKKDYLPYEEIPFSDTARFQYLMNQIPSRGTKDDVYQLMDDIYAIPWKTLHYTFYLIPKATPRPKASFVNGHAIFYVKGAKDHSQFLKYYLKIEDNDLIKTPVKFTCKAYLPTPKSMRIVDKILAEYGFIRPISKPDWDNLAKTYCDMITDTILYDDRLIIEGTLKKYYSIKPRVEITLEYMEDYDCNFNRKKIN